MKSAGQTKTTSANPGGRLALTARCEVRAASGTEPGIPRRFRMVANTGEPMSIGGFDSPVVVDLSSIDLSGLPVPALYDHCPEDSHIVGVVESATTNGAEFIAEGRFCPIADDKDKAAKVLAKADAGYVWQTSVGGDPKTVEKIQAGQSAVVNGRTYAGPVCIARGLVLREISFVVLGGDRRTSAVVTRLKGSKKMRVEFEDFAKGLEIDPESMSEAQGANLRRIHSELYPDEEEVKSEDAPAEEEPKKDEEVMAADEEPKKEDEAPTNAAAKDVKLKAKAAELAQGIKAQIRAEAVAEQKRIKGIQALAKEYGPQSKKIDGETVDIAAHAIEKGWTVQKTELEVLRASRGSGPTPLIKKTTREDHLAELQAGMILRAGGKLDHKAYRKQGGYALLAKTAPWLLRDINDAQRDRYMNAGHRYSSMSMVDVCRESLRLNGQDIPHEREEMIRAAFSGGGNLSNVFTTNVNAILLATYDEFSVDTTQGWVSEQDVNDFKTNERPRVNVGDGLKCLPRGGEAEHTSYTDTVESYKIAKYARQFEIDDQDIVDDNFSVFADVPAQMGRAAARLRPDLVYGAVILANPTLSATSLAVFSGSNATDNDLTTALSHASLSTALATMRIVRENSVNLNLEATHLIIPPALEDLARELTMSTNILYGGDDEAVRGSMNSLNKRGLQIVAEPRLQNGVTNPADETSQSGSSTVWYLACANAHTIEVGYLKGHGRAPRVRSTVLDKGRWGMNWDVEMCIGVKALDWKGLVRS